MNIYDNTTNIRLYNYKKLERWNMCRKEIDVLKSGIKDMVADGFEVMINLK